MASPTRTLCDDILHPALAHMIGARVDATHLVPETGLLVLSLHQPQHKQKLLLGFGIGPVTTGIGLLPQLPQGRATNHHPLLAALRAHLVGLTIHSVHIKNDSLQISCTPTSQESLHTNENILNPLTYLELVPLRHGSARVISSTGAVVKWPAIERNSPGSITKIPATTTEASLESIGAELLTTSDSFRLDLFRKELARILKQKCEQLARRVKAVQQDLSRLDDVPRLQKIGTLLLTQGKTLPRGTTLAKLIDWDTNEPLEIPLSPEKPPHEQAPAFFQKARRWQQASSIMQNRLHESQRALANLESLQFALYHAPDDWNVLHEISQNMQAAGCRGPSISPSVSRDPKDKPRHPDERLPYHIFRSTNQQVIWVGRSSRDNDELVTRFARPHDLWLHAKNIRGAHVVVPLEKNRSCPSDLLVDAATLAAHFSDARNETICEVSYVERRYVRKPKKSLPGIVTTQREKVLVVRVEKDRLARLLGSKVET